ncbi:MAG: MBOAT family O-acyltransferase, partial [Kiritimatiellia bacterium]
MIFTTVDFALFFLLVFALCWALRRQVTLWKWGMLGASWFFYGYWDWRFVGLLAGSSVLNHFAALGMERNRNLHVRRTLLVIAVCLNIGSIAFFKYAGFLYNQAFWIRSRLGEPDYDVWLNGFDFVSTIILPVGISFFTFQALSYVVDVYRGRMKTADSLLDFALYLAFFPQLVAGPIVRAVDLVGQLAKPLIPEKVDIGRASFLILGGLFKKIVIANFLSERIVDPVFARPDLYGAWDTLFAVYGYAIQIYCDFSAYSDMAIGFCLLMGFHIPLNFDAPYLAGSIQKFWRRWHISLSSFLRDYLYIPLGGSRGRGEWGIARNLMITFLLGGLWHGAGWTFIAWGALHGIYLTVERWGGKLLAAKNIQWNGPVAAVVRRVAVWHLVCLSWLFFRGEDFEHALNMLRALGRWDVPVELLTGSVVFVLIVGYLTQLLDGERCEKAWDRFGGWHPVAQGVIAAAVLMVILGLGPKGVAPFIYFQF